MVKIWVKSILFDSRLLLQKLHVLPRNNSHLGCNFRHSGLFSYSSNQNKKFLLHSIALWTPALKKKEHQRSTMQTMKNGCYDKYIRCIKNLELLYNCDGLSFIHLFAVQYKNHFVRLYGSLNITDQKEIAPFHLSKETSMANESS